MTKSKVGRKSKYDSDVKPRFDEIKKWCEFGATDKEIMHNLGISKDAFYKYKKNHTEFNDLIKNSRKSVIYQIKAALFKRAIGFKESVNTTTIDNEGNVTTTTKEQYFAPDPASAMILLKHWARDEGWTNDPAQLDLKKKELDLKKEQIEKDNW